MPDWSKSPEFQEYAKRVIDEMLPKMSESEFTLSLAPQNNDAGDVKYWVELGASIMLDKPIIVIAGPGQKIPERLKRVADHVVYVDMSVDAGMQQLQEKLAVIVEKINES